MRIRATDLAERAALHFGKSEAARYVRMLGEGDVGVPQGKPGPGGGVFFTSPQQVAVFLLALAASPTALRAAETVRPYLTLPGKVERKESVRNTIRGHVLQAVDLRAQAIRAAAWFSGSAEAREAAEDIDRTPQALLEQERKAEEWFKPLPPVLARLRDEPHTLLEALVWLLEAARSDEGRARLAETLDFTVYQADPDARIPEARIVVDDRRSGQWFLLRYRPDPANAALARLLQGGDARQSDEADAGLATVFSDRLIRDFGALLGELRYRP